MTRLRQVGEAVTGLLSPQAKSDAPAVQRGAPRTVRDWGARPRDTILSALRYTQFVGFMKRALPIAAGSVVAAVGAFFFFQRAPDRMQLSYQSIGHVGDDLAMIKPRLAGTDDAGNPFVVTFDTAIQDRKNPKRARLEKIDADMQIDKQRWLNARATRGFIDLGARTLVLWDWLSVYSDEGYELHTKTANVDLSAFVMTGPEVTGQGPLGSLRADTFTIDRTTRQLVLTGNVHMTLTGVK